MDSLDFDAEGLTGDLGVTTALERACTLHDKVRLAMDRLKPMPGSRIPKRMEHDREALVLLRDKLEVLEDQLRECRLLEPSETDARHAILCQLDSTRRDIIAACREGLRVVVSCQELCKEVLGFCELTPQETITPRSMPASWRVASSVAASRYGAVAPASTEGTITSEPTPLSLVTEASSGPQQHRRQQHGKAAAGKDSRRPQGFEQLPQGATGSSATVRRTTDPLPSSLSTWRHSSRPTSPSHTGKLGSAPAAKEAATPEASASPPVRVAHVDRFRVVSRADQADSPPSVAARDVPDYGGKVSVRQYANIPSDSEGTTFAARETGHHLAYARHDYLPRLRTYASAQGKSSRHDVALSVRDTTSKPSSQPSQFISPAKLKAAATGKGLASGSLPTIREPPHHQHRHWLRRLAMRLLKLSGSLAATAVLATAAAITVAVAVDEVTEMFSRHCHDSDSEEVLLEPFPLPASAPGQVTAPLPPSEQRTGMAQQQQQQQQGGTVWGFPFPQPQQSQARVQQMQPQLPEQQQGRGRRRRQDREQGEAEVAAQQLAQQQQQQQQQTENKLKRQLTLMMPFGPMMPHPDVTAGQG